MSRTWSKKQAQTSKDMQRHAKQTHQDKSRQIEIKQFNSLKLFRLVFFRAVQSASTNLKHRFFMKLWRDKIKKGIVCADGSPITQSQITNIVSTVSGVSIAIWWFCLIHFAFIISLYPFHRVSWIQYYLFAYMGLLASQPYSLKHH